MLTAIEKGNSNVVNTTITNLMDSDPNIRFKVKHGIWTTGTSSPYDLIVNSKIYTAKDIQHPTLVL